MFTQSSESVNLTVYLSYGFLDNPQHELIKYDS